MFWGLGAAGTPKLEDSLGENWPGVEPDPDTPSGLGNYLKCGQLPLPAPFIPAPGLQAAINLSSAPLEVGSGGRHVIKPIFTAR